MISTAGPVEPLPPETADLLAEPDRHLEGLVSAAVAAANAGDLECAIRFADRARRQQPDLIDLSLLHAKLLIAARQFGAAVAAMAVDGVETSPEGLLLRAEAQKGAGMPLEAAATLDTVLTRYSLDTAPGLSGLASALCSAAPSPCIGWAGQWPDGRLSIWVTTAAADEIALLDESGQVIQGMAGVAAPIQAGFARTDWPAPWTVPSRRFSIVSPRGRILGGALRRWPPSFDVAGKVTFKDGHIEGWARLGWSPRSKVTVRFEDGAGRHVAIEAAPRGGSLTLSTAPFRQTPASLGLSAPVLFASVLLPDGTTEPLAGSPIFIGNAPEMQPHRPVSALAPARFMRRSIRNPRVAIVIPVYAGLTETLDCIQSVLRTVPRSRADILVVEDASPEPNLVEALVDLQSEGRIFLLRNPRNLGFPRSVNRGMSFRPDQDVVLLNSDTTVYADWLDRLQEAAYRHHDIATVTPFSNAGSIVSYPASEAPFCGDALACELDLTTRRVNAGVAIDLPTGVGFCLYIRRDCLDEIGAFEADAFGRGYGEENDFCLRARAAGWRNIAAADVFVRHIGGRSFGRMKELLLHMNLEVLNTRHPGYRELVAAFIAADPLHGARRALDMDRLTDGVAASVLIITLSLGGGVARHVESRAVDLSGAGYRVLELSPAHRDDSAGLCWLVVRGQAFDDLTFDLPAELPLLVALLARLHIRKIELHHFLGLSPVIFELSRHLGVAYDVYIHDYAWICPRVTLLSGDNVYCGEPPLPACEACVRLNGSVIEEEIGVGGLRARSAGILALADRVIVPSHDAARRIRRYADTARVVVEPWEDVPITCDRTMNVPSKGRIRVGLIGAIGDHKGYEVLRACAEDAEQRDLPLEFVVVGYSQDDPSLFATRRVFLTGQYQEPEVDHLLERERCSVAFYPSVWPETWCYALTPALRAGLPVLASDIGAFRERLAHYPRARLFPIGLPPPELNDLLIALASEEADRHNAVAVS